MKIYNTAIAVIEDWQNSLELHLPNHSIQGAVDSFGRKLTSLFQNTQLVQFNQWLDSSDYKLWLDQLAVYLVKLPIRSARNVLKLLYNMFARIAYTIIHPLQGAMELLKEMLIFFKELTTAENWSQLGGGIIGGTIYQALAFGGGLSTVGMGVGSILILLGLSMSSYLSLEGKSVESKLVSVFETIWSQAALLPESILTGIFVGVVMGKVQSFYEKWIKRNPSYQEAQMNVNRVIKKYSLPEPDGIGVYDDRIVAIWSDREKVGLIDQARVLSDGPICRCSPYQNYLVMEIQEYITKFVAPARDMDVVECYDGGAFLSLQEGHRSKTVKSLFEKSPPILGVLSSPSGKKETEPLKGSRE